MNVLEVTGLSKRFGSKEVLKGVTLEVPENCIYGLVGRNGAGKTTLMRSVLGLLPYDSGEVRIFQKSISSGKMLESGLVGYLPDVPEYYNYMTAYEYLALCGEITGIPGNTLKKRIEELLEMVGLPGEKHRIKGYSRGMKQRLGIAQALINKPKLLICDEPTSALDPIGRKEILDILKFAKKESAVIFSTHILSDVERISDRIGLLEGGIIKLSGTIEELKSSHWTSNLEIIMKNRTDLSIFDGMCAKKEVCYEESRILLKDVPMDKANEIFRFIAQNDVPVIKYELKAPTLEDLILEVIGKHE